MSNHLVFFDGTCGLCDWLVQFLLRIDSRQQFVFAPLQGSTAKKFGVQNFDPDTLVFVENYLDSNRTLYVRGKAVFRIFLLTRSVWSVFGLLYYLPAVCYDWAYCLVAKWRLSLLKGPCKIPPKETRKGRFLE